MRNTTKLTAAPVFVTLLVLAAVHLPLRAAQEGETPSVGEIVQKANQVAYYQGGTGRARVKMTIHDAEGRVRGERELIILRRNDAEGLDQRYYAYFLRPVDVRGTVFLVWKHTERDDDRWLYNPGLDLVNRIGATDKRTSFAGSHFLYEDVSGRRISDDQHELIKVTKDYFVLKNTPKNANLVEFSYYEMYIHRATFLPLYAFYYDKSGQKYREYRVLNMEQIGDHWMATKTEMRDLREQGSQVALTLAEYSDVKYGIELPEDIFTERYLRKPPRQYLQ